MKDRLSSSPPPGAKFTGSVCIRHTAKMLIVGLAFFCLPSVLNRAASGQGQTITIGVLEFQDESGAGQRAGVAQAIARKLAQKLNATHQDVMARHSKTAEADPIQTMTMEQLGALGKQQGVQYVVRGGWLPAGEGDASAETKAGIQLYADIVSVATLNTKTVRAAGNNAEQDQALASAIEQLAESIHQAIVSPVSEPAAPSEPTQDSSEEAHRADESTDADAAEEDEELQQLIAQAESLVADGSGVSGEQLASLSEALETLKVALKAKATLLEEGKDATSADQKIARQKNMLKDSLSSLAESEMSGAPDTNATQDQQSSGEKKNMLARIGEYAGETLNILQKIQEMRAAFRGANANSETSDTSAPDTSEEAALATDEAAPSTEEMTEEISGVVTEMGEPVAGVTVTEPESGAKAETDSNGSYVLEGVPAGRMAKLMVVKGGKPMASGQIDLPRGRSSIADFELKPKTAGVSQPGLRILPSTVRLAHAKTGDGNVGVLKGVVKDAQGRPAARALVRVGRAVARTDSQGRYAFLNVRPGAHQVVVQRSGSRPRTEMVQVTAKKSSESKIQFAAADKIPNAGNRQTLLVRGTGNVLRGVVLDPQKHPLADAKVTVVQQKSAVSVLAGPRGNYLLRDLKPGSYRVLVSKAGYVSTAQAVTVRAGDQEPRDFQLKKTESPFIQKALAARHSNQSLSAVEARKTGSQVDRQGPQSQPQNKIISARDQVLVQPKIGSLRGRASDSRTGKPVSGATISIQGRTRAKTDEEGNYSVPEVPAGSYQLSISRAGFADQERSVRVLAGNLSQENFVLVAENTSDNRSTTRRPQSPAVAAEVRKGAEIRKGQLSGRILDAKTGRPVPGVSVTVAGQRAVTSDRDGSYVFNGLTPGPYRVIARKSEFLDGITSLVIRPGETTTANLRLNARPTPVR